MSSNVEKMERMVLTVLVVVMFGAVFLAKADQREARLNIKVVGSEAKVTAEGEECKLIATYYDGNYSSRRTEMIYGISEKTVNISEAGDYVFTLRCESLTGDPQIITRSITSITPSYLSAVK